MKFPRKNALIVLSLLIFVVSVHAQSDIFAVIQITDQTKLVLPGDSLVLTTTLFNYPSYPHDIILIYDIVEETGETQTVMVDVVAAGISGSFPGYITVPDHLQAGVHTLRVTAQTPKDNFVDEATFIVIDPSSNLTQPDESLFDMVLTIPPDYEKVSPGNSLLSSIDLINIGKSGAVDVLLELWITKDSIQEVYRKEESVSVETQTQMLKRIDIPDSVDPGQYTLNAKITYSDGKIATAQQPFEVRNKNSQPIWQILTAVLALFNVVLLGLLFRRHGSVNN